MLVKSPSHTQDSKIHAKGPDEHDASEHGDVLHSLKSPHGGKAGIHDDAISMQSAGGAFHHSASRLAALDKLGKDAAVKLRTDTALIGAEASRTRSLFDLKKRHLDARETTKVSGMCEVLIFE